jgi:hypothetical protein
MKLKSVLLSPVVASATNVAQPYDWQPLPAKAPEPADNPTTPEKDAIPANGLRGQCAKWSLYPSG